MPKNLETDFDIIDFSAKSEEIWIIMKNKKDTSKLLIKYRLPNSSFKLDASANPKVYSEQSRTLIKKIVDANTFRGKIRSSELIY